MRKWFRLALPLLALIVAVLACESTGGSTVNARQACDRSGSSGTCEGGYDQLSGSVGVTIEDDLIRAGDAIPVEASISVESGTLRISLTAPDGTVASAEASPGSPAGITGTATGNLDEFSVTLEAVGGDVTGVAYTITYGIP